MLNYGYFQLAILLKIFLENKSRKDPPSCSFEALICDGILIIKHTISTAPLSAQSEMEIDETINASDDTTISLTDTDSTQPSTSDNNNLWTYMIKQEGGKAKCKICNVLLSRKNGATSGLRKHLDRIHQIKPPENTTGKPRSGSYRVSVDQKKKLDTLIISCIVEDGRSFNDMRKPGIMKLFNQMAPGE